MFCCISTRWGDIGIWDGLVPWLYSLPAVIGGVRSAIVVLQEDSWLMSIPCVNWVSRCVPEWTHWWVVHSSVSYPFIFVDNCTLFLWCHSMVSFPQMVLLHSITQDGEQTTTIHLFPCSPSHMAHQPVTFFLWATLLYQCVAAHARSCFLVASCLLNPMSWAETRTSVSNAIEDRNLINVLNAVLHTCVVLTKKRQPLSSSLPASVK